ncbi:MAG: TonB-dependent receptor [candidate division WOR-3 bacterium]
MVAISFFSFLLNAIISGYVYDYETKEPLIGCNIYLENTIYGTTTNKEGYYILQIPEGKYKIAFSYIGYLEEKREISLNKGEVLKLNIYLKRSPLTLKEVIVESRKARMKDEVGISKVEIMDKDIKLFPRLFSSDFFRSLQVFPGVLMATDFSSALYVRGGGADQNLILVDGINFYNPYHLGGFLGTIPNEIIKQADFYTGGFSTEYSQRLSSVLDITLKEGNKYKRNLNLEINNLLTKIIFEGPIIKEKSSYILAFRRTYFDQFLKLLKINFPYYFLEGFLKTNYEISQKGKLFFTNFLTYDNFNYSDLSLYFKWGNYLSSLSYLYSFSPKLFVKSFLTFSYYHYYINFYNNFVYVNNWVREFSLKSDFNYYLAHNHALKFGIEGKLSDFYYDTKLMGGIKYDILGKPRNLSFYLSERSVLYNNKLILESGLRQDNQFTSYYGNRWYKVIDFRFSLKYFLLKLTSLKLSFGSYSQLITALLPEFQPIPFLYIWIPTFGPYSPQKAYHNIFGFETYLLENIYFSIEPYYKYYPLIYEYNENSDPFNIEPTLLKKGKAKAYGLDISIKREAGNFLIYLTYSYAWVKNYFNNLSYHPFYDRRHNLNLIIILPFFLNSNLSFRFAFYTGTPYTEVLSRYRYYFYRYLIDDWRYFWFEDYGKKNASRYPNYHRLDLSWEKEIKRLKIRIDIFNLYNHKNFLFYYYDYHYEPPVRKVFYQLPIIPSLSIEYAF